MSWALLANEHTVENNAGKTIVAIGNVNAKDSQALRTLKRRSPIYRTDIVSTGHDSNTQLRMIDGALLSLQEQTQLSVVDYQFDQTNNQGNVGLSLIKGGLRTITGILKGANGNYKMQTPVASIGVRGTHYEAEMLQGDLYLSVWDGIIDVNVTVGDVQKNFSIGNGQDFNFAIVRSNGTVEFSLLAPKTFAYGHNRAIGNEQTLTSNFHTEIEEEVKQQKVVQLANIEYVSHAVLDKNYPVEFDQSGNSWIDNDDVWANLSPDSPEVISDKSGLVIFDQLLEQSISSSAGPISDLLMSMTVNFDTGRVPTGQVSFNDSEGQWFAVFNGTIAQTVLEININFASHGNQLADGDISGVFLNNGTQVLGDISLSELNNSSNTAGGGFLLIEKP